MRDEAIRAARKWFLDEGFTISLDNRAIFPSGYGDIPIIPLVDTILEAIREKEHDPPS